MSPQSCVLALFLATTIVHAALAPTNDGARARLDEGTHEVSVLRGVSRQYTGNVTAALPPARDRRIPITLEDLLNTPRCKLNICFALQSSKSVSTGEFQEQTEFSILIAAIIASSIGKKVGFSAAQYGRTASEISPLTFNADTFINRIDGVIRENQTSTSPAAGVGYCVRSLSGSRGHANVIVLLGNGRSDVTMRRPRSVLRGFRGLVTAVGVGNFDRNALTRITRSSKLVFTSQDITIFADIVDSFANRVCLTP